MKKTKNASKILDRLTGDDMDLRKLIAQERVNAKVARMIYDMRMAVGYSQTELAKLVGTQQSVIARLEDADYQGHSLSILTKIATVCNREIRISVSESKNAKRDAKNDQLITA